MKTITIREMNMPALGFGTWQLKGDACREGIVEALEHGYRHIDTAQAYENEEEVGAGIKKSGVPRKDIFLTTKVWMSNVSHRDMDASVAESLCKLRVDSVDLLLIHWPVEDVPLEEQMEALADLKHSGKARHIGVSNFPVAWLERAQELCGGKLICNQVEYHPFISQEPVLDFLRTHGMCLTAYCPLARGKVLENDVLKRIAEKHEKQPSQIALRWLIDQDNVAAIPKAAKSEHMRSNFDIFDFELDGNDRREINRLQNQHMRLLDPDWAPQWDDAQKRAA